jgi:hypothetical protein
VCTGRVCRRARLPVRVLLLGVCVCMCVALVHACALCFCVALLLSYTLCVCAHFVALVVLVCAVCLQLVVALPLPPPFPSLPHGVFTVPPVMIDPLCLIDGQDVIDGDLCEAFAALPAARQRGMAEDLGKTVGEVIKKLEDIRARVL